MDKSNKKNTLASAFATAIEPVVKKVLENNLIPEIKKILKEKDRPEYYTTKDLEQEFGLNSQRQYDYRQKGLIEYVQIGQKVVYPSKEVHDFMNEHTNPKTQ